MNLLPSASPLSDGFLSPVRSEVVEISRRDAQAADAARRGAFLFSSCLSLKAAQKREVQEDMPLCLHLRTKGSSRPTGNGLSIQIIGRGLPLRARKLRGPSWWRHLQP